MTQLREKNGPTFSQNYWRCFQGSLSKSLRDCIWKGTLWHLLEDEGSQFDEQLQMPELKEAHAKLNEWFF